MQRLARSLPECLRSDAQSNTLESPIVWAPSPPEQNFLHPHGYGCRPLRSRQMPFEPNDELSKSATTGPVQQAFGK
jgi:hypothetical protein